MAKQYQWRTASIIISGGYSGEETGVINGNQDWVTTNTMSGSTTEEYYYRDSDYDDNANSSRVVVSITESWTASIDDRNYLTVNLTTTVNSIRRDDVRGTAGVGTRSIFIRREEGGPILWSTANDSIATAHSILSTPITLDSYSFVLAPGENLERGSIYFRNNSTGHDNDPVPSIYVDLMWIGTAFRNILPADYRPGKTYDATTSTWLSHNRASGWAGVWDGNTFAQMRTLGNGEITDNPPLIKYDDAWRTMRQIGSE